MITHRIEYKPEKCLPIGANINHTNLCPRGLRIYSMKAYFVGLRINLKKACSIGLSIIPVKVLPYSFKYSLDECFLHRLKYIPDKYT